MAKRSLQASQEGAKVARKTFDLKGWTQENLATELDLKTRQPIWRFFTCRPIERHIFLEICHILDLNWWEIAEHPPEFLLDTVKPPESFPPEEPNNEFSIEQIPEFLPRDESKGKFRIEQVVEQVRTNYRNRLENQCSILRVLDTNGPVCFDGLYVPIDVIEPQGTSARWIPAPLGTAAKSELQSQDFSALEFAGDIAGASRLPASEAVKRYSKLRISGKPGSGKTSFLKYLALQCIQGGFEPQRVPLLIHLESFAAYIQESGRRSLLSFICYELSDPGVSSSQTVITLLTEGRFVLLMDAFDEVSESDSYVVYKEITRFSERYYKNQFVLTARLNSDRFELPQFTDIEIADLTDEQVTTLSNRWFKAFSRVPEQKEQFDSAHFLQQLRLPENQLIAELSRVPLFFNCIAQLFQRQGKLKIYHLEIYETCLNILFERWDRSRGVNRDLSLEVPLSIKQSILLQLAAIGFQQNRFQFKRREILELIEGYCHQQHPDSSSLVTPHTTSRALLTVLEQDHGLLVECSPNVFSFAFPGFQCYFAAQWIARCTASGKSAEVAALDQNVATPEWQEVMLLACELTVGHEQVLRDVNF